MVEKPKSQLSKTSIGLRISWILRKLWAKMCKMCVLCIDLLQLLWHWIECIRNSFNWSLNHTMRVHLHLCLRLHQIVTLCLWDVEAVKVKICSHNAFICVFVYNLMQTQRMDSIPNLCLIDAMLQFDAHAHAHAHANANANANANT